MRASAFFQRAGSQPGGPGCARYWLERIDQLLAETQNLPKADDASTS
ncbi:MAG: hypothetical protein R3A10_15980 [Caldilineaceae bacterium]